eukprot:s510_g10.t1
MWSVVTDASLSRPWYCANLWHSAPKAELRAPPTLLHSFHFSICKHNQPVLTCLSLLPSTAASTVVEHGTDCDGGEGIFGAACKFSVFNHRL